MTNQPSSINGSHRSMPSSPHECDRNTYPCAVGGQALDFDLSQPYIRVFEQRLTKYRDRTAVRFEGRSLTYGELDAAANRVANYLLGRGISGNAIVAVCAERTMDLAATLLGIFKAGCVYLPLEPGRYPPERLRHILADARVKFIIDLDSQQRHASLFREQNREVLSLPADAAKIAEAESTPSPTRPKATDTAYLIYTSGTTGTPKGVMVSQRNLLNHNLAVAEAYRLDENDRVLQCCALGFDLSLEEIFPTWLCGATLVPAPFSLTESPATLLDFVAREKITVLNLPTAYWHELVGAVREHPLPDSVRLVIVGGEKASEGHFRRWRELVPRVRLINAYGPTETTITVTMSEKAESIGCPIANTYAYILKHDMQPARPGEEGELYFGGECVSQGYLNQPEKTAEVFLDDPFCPGKKIYRTGDLARLAEDGEIVFIGRVDNQIKLRGFRIEPGEIESALKQHPAVDNAVAVLRQDGAIRYLAAYVVPTAGEKIDIATLRALLDEKLPSYMTPQTITVVSDIPLNANGKVDYRALPEPDFGGGGSLAQTPTEKLLASIWHKLLNRENPGIDDNFFMCGGHSLLATRVCLEIERSAGVQLPIHAVFDKPTIRALAALVDGMSGAAPKRNRLTRFIGERKRFPASPLQRAMYSREKMSGSGNVFALPMIARLDGPVSPELLEQAINAVVAANENLRTVFETDESVLWQRIVDFREIALPLDDLSGLDNEAAETGRQEIIEQVRARRFNFAAWPLFSLRLLKLAEKRFELLFNVHHLIIDGWGISLFFQRLGEAYESLAKSGNVSVPRPELQYADFALWQLDWLKSGITEEQLAYWGEKLKDATTLPCLPFEQAARADGRETAARIRFTIPARLTSDLKRLADAEDSTLFMILTALLQIQMHKHTGVFDLTTGAVVANRRVPGTEEIMGLFVNTLALRNQLNPEHTFSEFLRQVKKTTLEAYHHQDTPFAEIQRRHPVYRRYRRDLFSVSLFLQNMPSTGEKFADVEMRCEELDYPSAAVKILFAFEERDGELAGHCEYMDGLFNKESIQDLATTLIGLAEQAARRPDTVIRQLDCPLPRHSRAHSCFIAGETRMSLVCAEKLQHKGFYLHGIFSDDPRVEKWAMEKNIPFYHPQADNMYRVMSAVDFDFLFSVIYSHVIPDRILKLPRRDAINYHDSPLPTYAGVNATVWAIANREKRHGVTWHRMTAEVDAGDILIQKEFPLEPDETVGHLNIKCTECAIDALDELVDELSADRIAPRPQDLSKSSCYKLHERPPAGCLIDWNQDAEKIAALVRALDFDSAENQFGIAKIFYRSNFFSVGSATVAEKLVTNPAAPGTIIESDPSSIVVAAGNETGVRIEEVFSLDGSPMESLTFFPGESVAADGGLLAEIDQFCRKTTPHESFWVERFRTLIQPEVPLTEADDILAEAVAIELPDTRFGYSSLAAFALFIAQLTGLESFDLPLEPGFDGMNETAVALFFPVVPLRICVSLAEPASASLGKLESAIAKTRKAGSCLRDIGLRYKQLNFFFRFPFRLQLAGTGTRIVPAAGFSSAKLLERYRVFLANLARDPECPLENTALLSEAEFQRQIYDWNDTRRDFDLSQPYVRVFEQRLARYRERTAVRFKGHAMTYGELDAAANRVANHLLERGASGNAVIAVCAERTMDLAATLLGIFKAGCVYLPLEPGRFPPERLRQILADSCVEIVIDLDPRHRHAALFRERNLNVVSLPADAAKIAVAGSAPPPTQPKATDTAYLIYTSGTTGIPKGVKISQRNLLNHNLAVIEAYQLEEHDRILQCGSLGFDLSLEEIFPTWLCGATLVPAPFSLTESPTSLLNFAGKERITVLNLPTAYWHEMVGVVREHPLPDSLRLVIIGGEKASEDHFGRWQELAPKVKVINTYGPTETTVIATLSETADTIGRPIANTCAYILDRCMQPVPPGVPGELCIGGECVGQGYLNRPQKTARAFPDNPFRPGEKMYRTGDLARFTEDGEIFFIGREDSQVKLRGFRIELSDIEIALKKHPTVDNAVAVLRQDGAVRNLAAYVVPTAGERIDTVALRAFVGRSLPSYMMPRTVTVVSEIPLNANGKVDHRALPTPFDLSESTLPENDEPREVDTTQELQVAMLFQRILGIRDFDYDASFFDLGGDSLGAIRLCLELEKSTGKKIPMDQLYRASSVKELAGTFSRSPDSGEKWSSLVVLGSGGNRPPLYLVHTTPGDILGYVNLISHIQDRPVYGLQAYGLNLEHKPHDTIKSMAEYYCELVAGNDPNGPYLLCGWCFGGIVAFEMAQCLHHQGRDVGFVGLIETWGVPRQNLGYKLKRLRDLWRWGPKGWKEYLKIKIRTRHSSGASDARLDYIAERFSNSRSAPELQRLRELYAINAQAAESYEMTRYPGVIDIFQLDVPDSYEGIPDRSYGWHGLADEVRISHVPGKDHRSVLKPPYVGEVAAKISEALLNAEKRTSIVRN